MKALMLSILSLLPASILMAQDSPDKIINIPDPVLKTEILKTYDKNNDKEISAKEAEAVIIIEFYTVEYGCNVSSLKGIEAMPNLEVLSCANNLESKHFIKEVDLSHNPKLKHLDLFGNKLTKIDLSHNPELETVFLSSNQLSGIDVSKNPNINMLYIGNNPKIKSIKFDHLKKLKSFDCSDIKMDTLDLSNFTNLEDIRCSRCGLKQLIIGEKKRLVLLDCCMNNLKELDLSKVTLLFDPTYDEPELGLSGNQALKKVKVWPQFKEQKNDIFISADESTQFILPDGSEIK